MNGRASLPDSAWSPRRVRCVAALTAAIWLGLSLSAHAGPVSPLPYRLQPYVLAQTPGNAIAVDIGDITGDGRPDVVLSVEGGTDETAVLLYAQDASGLLAPPQAVSYGSLMATGSGLALIDLDGSNGLDVVVGNAGLMALFHSTENGGLTEPQVVSAPEGANYIEVLDLNADGREDLAATSWSNQGAVHLIGTGGMTSMPWPVAVSGYNQTAHGDLDADGDDDLVVGSGQGSGFVFIFRNVGDGMPQSIRFLQAPCGTGSVQGVSIGDYNADGLGDVALVSGGNLPNTCVAIFHGLGNYQFAPPQILPTYEIPGTTRTADLNGDGRDDLVVLHAVWQRIGVYLQDSTGTLGPEQLYELPFANSAHSEALALGDINSDRCTDVAIANDAGLLTLLGEGCEPLFGDGFEAGGTP